MGLRKPIFVCVCVCVLIDPKNILWKHSFPNVLFFLKIVSRAVERMSCELLTPLELGDRGPQSRMNFGKIPKSGGSSDHFPIGTTAKSVQIGDFEDPWNIFVQQLSPKVSIPDPRKRY